MKAPQIFPVELGGRSFEFFLHHRELPIGVTPSEAAQRACRYYWMDSGQFRAGRAGPNYRACVDFWWKAVEQAGASGELENQMNLMLAECYPLVNNGKAVKDLFLDAYLDPRPHPERPAEKAGRFGSSLPRRSYSLPLQEVDRIRAIVARRDVRLIQQEFESLFVGTLPHPRELPAFDEAARHWIGNGVVAFRTQGRQGLLDYTRTIDEWIRKLRKRGNLGGTRLYLNMFSYMCKAAFYTCYTSAWVGILNKLNQTELDNQLGHRIMRLWHYQNEPLEGSQTDVFFGQILALHPLSAVMMNSPEHLESIRAWFDHPDFEALRDCGRIVECREYWELVTAILLAAHEYKRFWQEETLRRQYKSTSTTNRLDDYRSDDTPPPIASVVEDFVASRGEICTCSAPWHYVSHVPGSSPTALATALLICTACHQEKTIELDGTQVSKWLYEL